MRRLLKLRDLTWAVRGTLRGHGQPRSLLVMVPYCKRFVKMQNNHNRISGLEGGKGGQNKKGLDSESRRGRKLSGERQNRERSDSIGRRLDAVVAEIDLGLAAMVRHMNIHSQQNFSSWKPAIGRVVDLVELLVGQIRYCAGAILEGIGEELHDGVFGRWRG